MCTIVIEDRVWIPDRVKDLDSFCRWACSDEFPEKRRISFLNGEVWVNMSPEKLFTHNRVKGEFAAVLDRLVKVRRLGMFCPDGMLIRNDAANLSTEPDGTFVSTKSLRSGRVTIERPVEEGCDVLVGTPDMVLEIVSDTSERKDTKVLRQLYWEAGIPEYWLVDPRGDEPVFDILRHGGSGYVTARKQAGWQKSKVFGKSFRLTVGPDELGNPEYTLSVR
ncbi:MAG TPA: Uma2 family endonuclease [Gemmataceae bacterium]|nr:Uma2 family endonuclease [Gemmataceae bacterium]